MRISNITIDCSDVMRVARFWSAVLERPLDAPSSEYFASIGGADPERSEPAWYFAKVPEAKRAKNRVHVDVTSPDPNAVQQLVALVLLLVAAGLFMAMAGHLAADCLFGTDCVSA